MMDRNREARRAAAMANGLHRRRHRTSTNSGSLRDSPEDDGPLELLETARLRDRTVKKDRDRDRERDRERDRDRDRDRERDHRDRDRDRERERLSRSKRRRGDMKYGSNREDGGGGHGGVGVDDSSEESVNDEEDEDDDVGPVRFAPPTNPIPMATTSPASTLTSHRKSYPPPSNVYHVAPSWKAPDEMIGFSVPRKARSASTKRSHDWTSGGGLVPEQMHRQASSSPVRPLTTASVMTAAPAAPSPQGPPISPSSSNISVKKKIKANGPKQRPPKSSSTKSSPSVQDEIEIEVAEVLYGLMRQTQPPSSKQEHHHPPPMSNDSAAKFDSRSTGDSKSRVSSPILHSPSVPVTHNSTSAPLVTVAPKRKRPRPCPDDISAGFGPRSCPKIEPDHALKFEPVEKNEGSVAENGVVSNSNEVNAVEVKPVSYNGFLLSPLSSADAKATSFGVEESTRMRNGMVRGTSTSKVEEASSSSPKVESLLVHDRVAESSSTSTKPNSISLEKENRREEKLDIDLMAPASPEKEEEMAEYSGGERDEKYMVTDGEAAPKSNANGEDHIGAASKRNCGGVESANQAEAAKVAVCEPHKLSLSSPSSSLQQHQVNLNGKKRNVDLQLDVEKGSSVNDIKSSFQQNQQPPKNSRDDGHGYSYSDKTGIQSSSVPLPMSVPAGWHGGLTPMGYVGPLQGIVSMDGTTMASPPIQPPAPHFLFSQPRPKRCATHWYIARSISVHQQVMKMNPFWPAAAAAAAAGTSPMFGAKPPYNLNMVPSADMHAGRGLVSAAQENKGAQPFPFFPSHGQPPGSSKDKSTPGATVSDTAQKQQFLLQPGLPPGAANNIMHAPALFFPMGQQQVAASSRSGTGKSPSAESGAALTSTSSSAPMGATVSNAPPTGPAMSFSYPSMGGNETQFMAILGNGAYPFPIPAHVGAAPPYRGSHPQAMSFFNGSFYSSQMLHPSQLQQQQPGPSSQSMQVQQQNHQNASISTASSSSQKHLQNQQQRPQGNSANTAGNLSQNQALQNFQGTKGREMGGEDSPSSGDSRNRPNLSFYGQNYAMPFQGPNFALMPSSLSGGPSMGAAVPNCNHVDKKQQQQAQQQTALNSSPFPMSFANMNGATTPGFDMSSITNSHTILHTLPDSAKHNYQMMAAAAAAQAAQQRKNNFRGPEDGKSGPAAAADASSLDEERKAMAARISAASGGQSIAFSRDLAESTVVDSSARSLNLVPGSTRPARSPGPNTATNSSSLQQQQQHHAQMLYAKQQQYVPSSAGNGRSKTPSSSNGNVYPDHISSSSIMAAKFPNSLPGFPSLVQTGGAPTQSPQWKNSARPNPSQMSAPSLTTTSTSMKNSPQQQGRSQQNQTQISFGAAVPNSKPISQGQQTQNSSQAPSSPLMVGSPSNSSMSKSAGGSPRTSAGASVGNKSGAQASALSSQQGKNSPSPSMSSQKPSMLGSPHIMSSSSSAGKSHLQQSQQQPALSKQSIQQAQLYFSNYMQASANNSAAVAGAGYYLQRHRPDDQQQQQGSKSQGPAPPTSSGGMLSLCTPVSFANATTSDPAKAVAAAAVAAGNMKVGLPPQGMFNAAQFAGQSAGGAHQLMPASYPYVHAVSSGGQVKPAEQKQPAGE